MRYSFPPPFPAPADVGQLEVLLSPFHQPVAPSDYEAARCGWNAFYAGQRNAYDFHVDRAAWEAWVLGHQAAGALAALEARGMTLADVQP